MDGPRKIQGLRVEKKSETVTGHFLINKMKKGKSEL